MSRKYQVQTGDVLTKIAQRFYGDATLFGLIAAANQLADPNKIAVGQVLSIPDQGGIVEAHVCVNGYLEAAPAA
jgi:nucleoid-associated protein YgaU